MKNEAKKYAKILGYNYNSSEWFERSYKVFDKNYDKVKRNLKENKEEKNNLFKKIIKMIKK